MSTEQQPRSNTKVSQGEAVAVFYLIASSHAAGITPFIRCGFGSEAFGVRAILALVAMAALSEGRWASGMGLYLIAWFFTLVYRRIETFREWCGGAVVHTRFIGWPWLAMRDIKDRERARRFEPVMCLLLGAGLCVFSSTVGLFVMGGFISIAFCSAVEQFAVYKRIQHMNDAVIEGEYIGEAFRRGR